MLLTRIGLQLGQFRSERALVFFRTGRHFEFQSARNALESLQRVVGPAQLVQILVQVFIAQSITFLLQVNKEFVINFHELDCYDEYLFEKAGDSEGDGSEVIQSETHFITGRRPAGSFIIRVASFQRSPAGPGSRSAAIHSRLASKLLKTARAVLPI